MNLVKESKLKKFNLFFVPANYDLTINGLGNLRGTRVSYSEITGILSLDAGFNDSAGYSTRYAATDYRANQMAISAYFTFAAAKSPTITKVAGVNMVPGNVTESVDMFSLSYGGASINSVCSSSSTCSIYNQIGTGVLSIVQGSAGFFTINFSKTYSKLNCTATTLGQLIAPVVNSGTSNPLSCSNCNSLTFTTGNPAVAYVNTYGTIMCQGSY